MLVDVIIIGTVHHGYHLNHTALSIPWNGISNFELSILDTFFKGNRSPSANFFELIRNNRIHRNNEDLIYILLNNQPVKCGKYSRPVYNVLDFILKKRSSDNLKSILLGRI